MNCLYILSNICPKKIYFSLFSYFSKAKKYFLEHPENFCKNLVDPDDSLNKTKSDSTGHFTIYGEECEIGSIEPYLRITHNCEDGALSQVLN